MWNSVSIDGSQAIIIHSPSGESQRQEEMNQLGSARRQAVESRPRPRSFDVSRALGPLGEGTMKNGTYRKLRYLRIGVLKTFWDESDEPSKKRGPGWWILLGNFRCAEWEVETGSWSRVCLPHFFRPAVLVTSIWISVSNSKHHLLSILDFYDTGGKQ